MSITSMAVHDDWLTWAPPGKYEVTGGTTLTIGSVPPLPTSCTTIYDPTWVYHSYPWAYPVPVQSEARPIKLTLREVERLRTAAHSDPALKAVLEKFTALIEVQMSLEP
jgi:hypothetical protein